MAGEQDLDCITKPAGADLSERQYRFVKLGSAGTVDVAGTSTRPTGILQNDPGSGKAASVAYSGRSFLKLGGSVDAGDPVTSGELGVGVVAGSGDVARGEAVEGGVTGDIISVILY